MKSTGCYKVGSGTKNYNDAQTSCNKDHDGWLATPASQTENDNIISMSSSTTFWIGIDDQVTEGVYTFVNNEGPVTSYTNWRSGEPNNAINGEDCVQVANTGGWNDLPCSDLLNFVCETNIRYNAVCI
jgi:hypothetical protein